MTHEGRGDSNDRIILIFLGVMAVVCVAGIVVLDLMKADAQPLVGIAGAAVGALATKITQNPSFPQESTEDEFAIIGRAATKSIIVEAMRQMGANKE